MRARDIFNKARKHLLKQKKAAKNEDGTCEYRSDNGLRCAVGCLIPKRVYDSSAEGDGIRMLRISGGKWVSSTGHENPLARMLTRAKIPATSKVRDTLIRLQDIHDGEDPADWESSLKRAKKELEL